MKPEIKVYEKLPIGTFVEGVIVMVDRDKEYATKYKDDTGETVVMDAVKLKFSLQGIEYQKSTPWMRFSYSEKSNLFKKFIVPLVEGAKKDMDFDIEQLVGMKIKTIWIDGEDPKYQNLQLILPLDNKIVPDPNFESDAAPF